MKALSYVTLLVASLLVLCAIASANNITYGQIGPYDRRTACDYVERAANWFTKHKEVINFPPKGHENFKLIKAIRITDYCGKKCFGYATLLKGGPGFYNSSIEVRSQTRKPLNMTIEYFTSLY